MSVKNTIWFGVADEISASTAATTIVLQDDVYVYPVSLEADTVLSFDYSQMNQVRAQSENWGKQFILLLKMGATVRSVTFPTGVKWNCGITPTMNAASKNYLVRFDMYGAASPATPTLLGAYDGSFN